MREPPVWIAVDWGTSRLRAWAMGPDDRPLEARASEAGMARLDREAFAPTLAALLGGWLDPARPRDVVICGMAGSRQGWCEAPYRTVPVPLSGLSGHLVTVPDAPAGAIVRIVPGLRQLSPPDVIRGEETQLAGLLTLKPAFAGVVCLPGTHSKWAEMVDGAVTRFATVMTGELFDLLAHRSILRHSVDDTAWDQAAFDAAVGDALADPARVPARLFGVRAGALVGDQPPAAAIARLSGLLIGQELAAVLAPSESDRPVALVGASRLTAMYARALDRMDRPVTRFDGDDLVVAGLSRLRAAARPHDTVQRETVR